MDLMQPLDPFWGLFSRSDTMDCVQVNPVSWKGQRACDWCVQAKGGGQRKCSHVWIGCTRCICSLLGRQCSYSTSDGGFAYPPGFDIDLARMRVLARFERVRCEDLRLDQAQKLSFKRMGEKNASEWETEDRMSAEDATLRDFNAWRRNLLHDLHGGSKSNQISLLVLSHDFDPPQVCVGCIENSVQSGPENEQPVPTASPTYWLQNSRLMNDNTLNVLFEIGPNACAVLRALETNDLLCCGLATGLHHHQAAKKKKAGEAAGLGMASSIAMKDGEEARLKAAEEARKEEEARSKAAEEARLKAAEEEARKEEESRLKAAEEARKEEEAIFKAEEEARKEAEAR